MDTNNVASELLLMAKDLLAGKAEDEIADQIRASLINTGKVVSEGQMVGLIKFKGSKAVFKKVWDSMIKDEYLVKVSGGYRWNDEGSFTEK